MFPVADQVPVTGSYSSAEVGSVASVAAPPTTSTRPSRSRTARVFSARRAPSTRWGSRRPPGPATGIGLADGAPIARARGRRIWRCRGDRDHRRVRHRRDDGRQPQKAGARRQRPTDEQQGCRRKQGDAAAAAGPSGRTRDGSVAPARCRRSRPGRSTPPRTDRRSCRRRNEGRLRGAARTGRSQSSRSSPRSRSSRRESRPRAPDDDIPSARPISSELSSAT